MVAEENRPYQLVSWSDQSNEAMVRVVCWSDQLPNVSIIVTMPQEGRIYD